MSSNWHEQERYDKYLSDGLRFCTSLQLFWQVVIPQTSMILRLQKVWSLLISLSRVRGFRLINFIQIPREVWVVI